MGKKNKDLRSLLAKARDEWLESDEGKKCLEGTTYGDYLRNRIYTAFIAGWDAHESLTVDKRG